MEKLTITMDDVKLLLKFLEKKEGFSYSGKDTTGIVETKEFGKLNISLSDPITISSSSKEFIEFFNNNKPVDPSLISENPFFGTFEAMFKYSSGYEYAKKNLEKLGFKKVTYLGSLSNDPIFSELTLTYGQLSDSCVRELVQIEEISNLFPGESITNFRLSSKAEEIKIGSVVVGYYYKQLNMVQLLMNIFSKSTIRFVNNKYSNFDTVMEALSKIKLETFDNKNLIQRKVLSYFVKNLGNIRDEAAHRYNDLYMSYTSTLANLTSYQQDYMREMESLNYIDSLIDSGGEKLLEEMDKVQKLPFVDSIKLDGFKIILTMKESSIKVDKFVKGIPPKYVFVGKVKFEINSSKILVTSDIKEESERFHVHVDGGGHPCFGDSSKEIMAFLWSGKWEEMAKLLWFWIKIATTSGYISAEEFTNRAIHNGIPIWDNKGNRLTFETTLDGKKITKTKTYLKNLEKYKDVAFC